MFSLPSRLQVRLPPQREAGGHIKSHWNVERKTDTAGEIRRLYISRQAYSKHLPQFSRRQKCVQTLASFPLTYSCALTEGLDEGTEEEEGHQPAKTSRLLLFPLVGCFRLLPLNHAAPHDAVKTPQVEQRDGAKQSHGDDLRDRDETEGS